MRLPARYLRMVRIPLVTLGTERFTVFGAPAAHAHAHIQHIFLFILRFSPHSSPSVKAKPPTVPLTSDLKRNANVLTFSTFFMLLMLVWEPTEPTQTNRMVMEGLMRDRPIP